MTPKLLTEAIGAFVLLFTIGLASVQEGVPAPLAIGMALTVVVYAGGHVSGAHYNPAVTIAVWLRGALPGREVLPYIGAQLVGAFVAAFMVYKFIGFPMHVAPGADVSALKAVTGEAIFAFAHLLGGSLGPPVGPVPLRGRARGGVMGDGEKAASDIGGSGRRRVASGV